MRKKIARKIAVTAMGITILGSGLVGTNGAVAKQLSTPTTVRTVQAKTRKPKTITHNCTEKLKDKKVYVGLGRAGLSAQTKSWKSSNVKIATVSAKGDSDGGHKVTLKKKGKVTISCVVNKTAGSYVKGDVVKWVMTIK